MREISLKEAGKPFPVDVQKAMDDAEDTLVPLPPSVLGRNQGVAFGLSPVDQVRLGELLVFMRKIGFVTQSIEAQYSISDYVKVKIQFAQAGDRRIPDADVVNYMQFGDEGTALENSKCEK